MSGSCGLRLGDTPVQASPGPTGCCAGNPAGNPDSHAGDPGGDPELSTSSAAGFTDFCAGNRPPKPLRWLSSRPPNLRVLFLFTVCFVYQEKSKSSLLLLLVFVLVLFCIVSGFLYPLKPFVTLLHLSAFGFCTTDPVLWGIFYPECVSSSPVHQMFLSP